MHGGGAEGRRSGRRGVGSIVGALIIVLLLLLGVAAYMRQQSLSARRADIERLVIYRQSLEAQAKLYLRAGVVGGPAGYNGTIGVFNGLNTPVRLRAVILVTLDGDVGLLTSDKSPPWLTGASATLYRVVGGALETVNSYPSLASAIASGLVIPPGHLLEIRLEASRELDLLRTRLGFDAPLALSGAGVGPAEVPVSVSPLGVYPDLKSIVTGAPPSSAQPGQPVQPVAGCVLPVNITNNASVDLDGYAVRVELNSSNFDDWSKLQSGGLYFTLNDGTPLYYYVESMDPQARVAVFWVNVSLPAASTETIILHYNTTYNPYPSYDDPNHVFAYYNPGDRLDFDWYPYDSIGDGVWGDLDGVDETAWSNSSGVIESQVTVDGAHMMAVKNLSLNGVCVEAEVNLGNLESIEEAGVVARVSYDSQTGGLTRYILRVIYNPDRGRMGFELLAQYKGSIPAHNETYPGVEADKWYKIRLCVYSNRAKALIETPDGRVYTLTITDPQAPAQGFPGGAGLHSAYTRGVSHEYRNVRVRPYIEPEPSVAVGRPTCYQPPPPPPPGQQPPTGAPWLGWSRYRLGVNITSPYTRSDWPVALRVDFGDLGMQGIVDPRTIYVATPAGSVLPLNLTEVSPNIYWLVFPANLSPTGSTYYIYFDTEYRFQMPPPAYPVGLARPVSGVVEEAHTNLDLERLIYGSGWGGNWYALLVTPRGYLEPLPSGGTPVGPGETALGFRSGYYDLGLTSVYIDQNMALLAPGHSGQPGASGIASTPVIAALWGDVEADEARILYTYSTHGGRLFRVTWSHSEMRIPEGWLEGWEYRLPITVTWTGSDALEDVIVTVDVSGISSVFQYSNESGSDLRFALPNGTLLQAYPAVWDPRAEEGVFYVKIPRLEPGEHTIYLYYGNPNASAYWSSPQDLGLKRGYNPGAQDLETVNDWYPRKSDLYQRYWGDAGRDAFDSFGYPTLSYNSQNYNLPMGPGGSIPLETWVDLGDFRVHVRVFFADDVEHDGISNDLVWAMELIPDQNYQGQAVSVWLRGNLGSDGATRSTSHQIVVDGVTYTYYVSNDEWNVDEGTGGDPQIRYAGIAGDPGDQGTLTYARSGDNVNFFGFQSARLPLTIYLAVGDTGRSRWEAWLESSIGWILPYIPSGGNLTVTPGRPGGYPVYVAEAAASLYPSGDVLLQYPSVNLTWGNYSIGVGSGGDRWICAVSSVPGDERAGIFDPGQPDWQLALEGVDLLFLNLHAIDAHIGRIEENLTASPRAYYRIITLDIGSLGVDRVEDYPVLLRVDTATLVAEGKLDPQLSHLMFADSQGDLLPYYVLPETAGTNDTWIYVKIPELPSGGQVTIYMIYGPDIPPQNYTPADVGLARGPPLDLSDPDNVPAHVNRIPQDYYDNVWVPQVSDLGATYWSDAGRDAFDGWGHPRYSWGNTTNPTTSWGVMRPLQYHGPTSSGSDQAHLDRYADPAARSVENGGRSWYAFTLMPAAPVLEILLMPDEASCAAGQQFSFRMSGNLGSDGATSGPYTYTATLADGSEVTFYMTNDDGGGTSGDPRIWYIGVAGMPDEQGLFYMGRSGDNSWMGFHGARGPFTLMLIPADLNPQSLAGWLASEISWIPPCVLSGGYTYTIGGEQQGLPSV